MFLACVFLKLEPLASNITPRLLKKMAKKDVYISLLLDFLFFCFSHYSLLLRMIARTFPYFSIFSKCYGTKSVSENNTDVFENSTSLQVKANIKEYKDEPVTISDSASTTVSLTDSPRSTAFIQDNQTEIQDEFLTVAAAPSPIIVKDTIVTPSWITFHQNNPTFSEAVDPFQGVPSPIILNPPKLTKPETFNSKKQCLCKGCQQQQKLECLSFPDCIEESPLEAEERQQPRALHLDCFI
eukprot:Platyproteum_vivax@DN3380_c0_g1_i3.p1